MRRQRVMPWLPGYEWFLQSGRRRGEGDAIDARDARGQARHAPRRGGDGQRARGGGGPSRR